MMFPIIPAPPTIITRIVMQPENWNILLNFLMSAFVFIINILFGCRPKIWKGWESNRVVGWLAGFEGGYVVLFENKTQGLSLGLGKEWSEPDENMEICR